MRIKFQTINDISLPCSCLYAVRQLVRPKEGNEYYIYRPCGKCYRCRKRAAAEWAFRCEQESDGQFVYNMLLTYDDAHLPMYNGRACLDRQQFVDALKRLRYYIDRRLNVKIRFIGSGEYSPDNKRPHYHCIIFSPVPLEDDRGRLTWLNGVFFKKQKVNDGILSKVWYHGIAHIVPFRKDNSSSTGAMVSYMTIYMTTHLNSDYDNKFIRPFRAQSLGLGRSFLQRTDIMNNCRERHSYTYSKNGVVYSYPRYYRNKWITEHDALISSEKYYTICCEYDNYLLNLNHAERKKYISLLNEARSKERIAERENFVKVKKHRKQH